MKFLFDLLKLFCKIVTVILAIAFALTIIIIPIVIYSAT